MATVGIFGVIPDEFNVVEISVSEDGTQKWTTKFYC
jgi:hypothetical protein